MGRMSLRERIDQDLKRAMLDKNETARDALRGIKSELLLREVELGRPIEDAEATAVLQKSVKQRKDAIDSFRSGGRADLVEAEEKQLDDHVAAVAARVFDELLCVREELAGALAGVGDLPRLALGDADLDLRLHAAISGGPSS